MKRILLTLSIVILMTINGFAQYKPFQFGLSIAPSVSMTKSNCDIIDDCVSKLSYNFGFKGNFYFVENYGFSTGFNLLNLRGGYSFKDKKNGDISSSIKCQYLEIPLTMMMRTEKIGKARIVGNIGYGMGFRLNSVQENTNAKGNIVEMDNQFRLLRHAFIVKLGAEFNVYKSSCLSVFLAYNNNFSNIYKKDNPLEHNVSLNNLCLEIDFVF